MLNRIFISFILFIICQSLYAGETVLDKRISISIQNITLEKALDEIENSGGLMFSYNPESLPVDSIVSVSATQLTIQVILDKLVGNLAKFTPVGDIVVIKALPKSNNNKKQNIKLSGNIVDSNTGENIQDATVFVVGSAEAALTNQTGSYDLDLKSKDEYVEVYYSKKDYVDTVVVMRADEVANTTVKLRPKTAIDSVKSELLETYSSVKLFLNDKQLLLTDNIKDVQIPGKAQVSFVPMLSSNGRLNANTTNNLSFNVIGGYSGGVQGLEFGGVLNIDRNSVTGVQVGGVTNLVGGNMYGVQVAGILNTNRKEMYGVQTAGILNVNTDSLFGGQVAGFANITHGAVYGWQVAGFTNVCTRNNYGPQIAGFFNYSGEESASVQIAGFTNVHKNTIRGMQVSGFTNYAKNVDGMQVSGFLNKAKKVRGLQLGLINIADTVQGLSIGLLSFVKNGYKYFGIGRSDVYDYHAFLKTGTNSFYNIFDVGYSSYNDRSYVGIAYGLGTRIQAKESKFGVDVEATGGLLVNNKATEITEADIHTLTTVGLGFSYKFNKHLAIRLAPEGHYLSQKETSFAISEIPELYSSVDGRYNKTAWLGFNASIGFQF